jgi:hypothetical protein
MKETRECHREEEGDNYKMAKAPSGWRGESLRHSRAKRFGTAGGIYRDTNLKKLLFSPIVKEQALRKIDYDISKLEQQILQWEEKQRSFKGHFLSPSSLRRFPSRWRKSYAHEDSRAYCELPLLKEKLAHAKEARERLISR